VLDDLRRRLARLIAPAAARRGGAGSRMYSTARVGRLNGDWSTANTSADAELSTSLRQLRGRSRALIRDASYARRAQTIIINNVIGSGIGLEAHVMNERKRQLDDINAAIETAWRTWARPATCHTGGRLAFSDLERMAFAQIFAAGECFIRIHSRGFGGGRIPLALELIEAERVADEFVKPGVLSGSVNLKNGIEVDQYDRPVAYWVRQKHPGDLRGGHLGTENLERVPADQMFHLAVLTRWPQSRGEPWLHAAARRLNDMDGYSEAEIIAARASAQYMGILETPEGDDPLADVEREDGQLNMYLEAGVIQKLRPGEKFTSYAPARPNPALDPFLRYMLREVAAGMDVSYESLSRDYSQSNYSSSRLALLDDRDTWTHLQQWFIRSFREPLHRLWLERAVLARAIPGIDLAQYTANPTKFEAVEFRPRGWSWIDPTKEVEAYIAAVRAGFMTIGDVIALTGGGKNLEDVLRARMKELELAEELNLKLDTDPASDAPAPSAAPAAPATPADPDADPDDDGEDTAAPAARVVPMRAHP
jgi:lambda family phage portal protein